MIVSAPFSGGIAKSLASPTKREITPPLSSPKRVATKPGCKQLAVTPVLWSRRASSTEKADAFCDREQGLEQGVAKLLDFGSRRKERLTGPASRDLLEIGIFHFQGHRAPANLCSLASAPDLFDDRLEPLACGLECEDIGGKGVFRTKRLADPVGLDRPFVDAARDPVIIWPRLPEALLNPPQRPVCAFTRLSPPRSSMSSRARSFCRACGSILWALWSKSFQSWC